ncbi:hypothetical protein [Microbacterium sp. NPDC076895]|uniref:hypothetical protein n=1 Tax=Microbacterium sp. NPDC076895 TaxID=3154957 RepID=UPI00342EF8B8
MTNSTNTNYELKTIRAVRGMEDRAVKKWQADGWQVVSQERGKLRTEIVLRRARSKARPLPWIIGSAAVALALVTVITIGVLSERNSEPDTSAPSVPASESPVELATNEPASGTADDAECSMSGASANCTFGQTVLYTDETREGEVALEITVHEPVSFTPSNDATFWNSRATQVPALPVNVYFPVTITNVADEDRGSDFIFTQATNAIEGETEMLSVSDGDVLDYPRFDALAPGATYSFNNGWSMSTLDGIEFEVSIDGLAGGRVTFTR